MIRADTMISHELAAEYKSAELINQSVFLQGVIIREILLQSFEEFSLSTLLTL